MYELLAKTLLAYLLGSLSGSLLLGKLRKVDIRLQGSGNAGGTNAMRTQGVWFGLAVLAIDIAKGYLAVRFISTQDIGLAQGLAPAWLAVACAAGVVVGHVWPIFYGFRGGKGVATLLGAMLAVQPLALVPAIVVWLLVFVVSGFVGMASITAVLAFWPVAVFLVATPGIDAMFLFGLFASLLVIFTHRGNLGRMYRGEEHRSRIFKRSAT